MNEVEIGISRAEAFLKESDPWGTGFDHLGVKSSAGVKQVAQLRIQLRTLHEVKSTPTTEQTPKPPRREKRPRSPDDDEDLEALDESPDSAKARLAVYGDSEIEC